MTRRVFLHVGLPKTGTTYLQDALWANRDRLAERGLLLPGRRRWHLLASLEVREDPGLANRPGAIEHPWRALVAEIEGWRGDALVSHEFFGAASAEQARRAVAELGDVEVHVVVTARAMVDLFLSRWQEWVKNGARGAVDRYPPKAKGAAAETGEWGWPSFDLGIVLDRWGSAVPPERVHVLPMAPGRSDPQELWQRLLGVLGVPADGLEAPEAAANPSLGLVEIELLRRVNAHLEGFRSAFDRGRWIRGYLGEGGVLPTSREKFRPGEEKLAELTERAERALRMLREGGYDVVGDVSLLEQRDLGPRRHPSEVTDAELVDAAAHTIARMTSDVRSLTLDGDDATEGSKRGRGLPRARVNVPRLIAPRRKTRDSRKGTS
ncbi:hypothetical protein [Nocardioides ferulae]|uniref:hypothetical protein n=1 Tax=Nocardioides ferulae TaxID=2340821 RepID=UPI000EB4A1EB|nr:hypothetical protein [Nocardioides ferulae]